MRVRNRFSETEAQTSGKLPPGPQVEPVVSRQPEGGPASPSELGVRAGMSSGADGAMARLDAYAKSHGMDKASDFDEGVNRAMRRTVASTAKSATVRVWSSTVEWGGMLGFLVLGGALLFLLRALF